MSRCFFLTCGLLLFVVQPAFGQSGPPVATAPTGGDMLTYYPQRAMTLGKEGRAVIKCNVTPELTLIDCAVVSETPADFGFGAAAINLSRLFRMKPRTASGEATAGAQVTIPIAFKLSR